MTWANFVGFYWDGCGRSNTAGQLSVARRPSNLDNDRARAKGSVLVAGASGNCVVMLSLPYQISFLSLADGLILTELLSKTLKPPK